MGEEKEERGNKNTEAKKEKWKGDRRKGGKKR
jgi:hypothetical protein